jgi:hypothetical protein
MPEAAWRSRAAHAPRGRRLRALARLATRQPLGTAGALIVVALVATAALAPLLAPHGPKEAAFAPY